jgi:hypothetical protein
MKFDFGGVIVEHEEEKTTERGIIANFDAEKIVETIKITVTIIDALTILAVTIRNSIRKFFKKEGEQ